MTKRLFLHIGLPKTGSTSMQKWFFDHKDALQSSGCTYPTDPPLQLYKQGYVAATLRGREGVATFERALCTATSPDVLLSNEGLANHFHDFDPDTLAQFRTLTANMSVHLIGFHRAPDRWLRSYHRQAVLNPRNNASDLWGTTLSVGEIRTHIRVRRLLDHDRLAQDMADGFGAQAVHMFDFDKADAFARMLSVMGQSHLAHLPLPRINETVPDWAITLMRHINTQEADNPARQVWKGLLFHFLDSNHTELRNDARRLTPQDLTLLNLDLLRDLPSDVPAEAIMAFAQKDFPARISDRPAPADPIKP